jgi:hypothetical protein
MNRRATAASSSPPRRRFVIARLDTFVIPALAASE